jgi:hypothetical protein
MAIGALASRASAQQPAPSDAAMAETLFEEAKKLMAQSDYAAACPKLAESNRLDPGSGTLTALALCHEQQGKTASAWAEFIEVVDQAQRAGRADRVKFAQQHVTALEPKLSRLTITVTQSTAGLEVRRDGVVVGNAAWGMAAPVDPGEHVVEASGTGKRTWSARVTVGADGDTKSIAVPALEDEAPPPTTTTRPPPPRRDEAEPPAVPPETGGSQRTIGLVLGGAGVVAIGVGSFFGLRAISESSDAKKLCSPSSCTNPDAVATNDDAKTAAIVSDVAIGAGIVAVLAGGYLFLSAPSGAPAAGPKQPEALRVAPAVGRNGAGLILRGQW